MLLPDSALNHTHAGGRESRETVMGERVSIGGGAAVMGGEKGHNIHYAYENIVKGRRWTEKDK